MKREFAENSDVLFGREPDLAYLVERSQQRGVTAVVGRPQMGKTWLLTELARRLSQGAKALPSSPSLLSEPSCMVGLAEAVLRVSTVLSHPASDILALSLRSQIPAIGLFVVYFAVAKLLFVPRASREVDALMPANRPK